MIAAHPTIDAPVVDRDYCASSFLALRHVYRPGWAWRADAVPRLHRRASESLQLVSSALEMEEHMAARFAELDLDPDTTGVLLSGGIDSAIVASYLPRGARAFTFRFDDEPSRGEEGRARAFATRLGLRLIEVPIDRHTYERSLGALMRHRWAPVHSIEPQIYAALESAQQLGVTTVATGENADSVFGGFDGLVGTVRTFRDFVDRFTFIDPRHALVSPVDYLDAFAASRDGESLDAHHFMSTVFADESLNSYLNPASLVGIDLVSPFAEMTMAQPLDVHRVDGGDSKYLVRELFRRRFAGLEPLPKRPMPRTVGVALEDWEGPRRQEFTPHAATGLNADQRWMLFALEQFLEMLDAE